MNTSGIGLGHVISQKLATNLGGEISFKSEENIGSTFKFTVKLEQQVNDSDSESEEGSSENEIMANQERLVF